MRSSGLAAALPKTRSMTKNSFRSLMKRYGKVTAKPGRGEGGVGVISITATGGETYKVHYGSHIKTISGFSSMYAYVKSKTKGASYIVQRTIHLAKVNGRPFDARVMLQRSRSSGWALTGKLAKIAGPGYFITNIKRSKGKVVSLPTAIRESNIRGAPVSRIQSQMDRIGLKTAAQLRKYYPIRILGLDVGIDRDGKVWIIEANFKPSKDLFLKLKDKSMYRRIVGFHKKRR